MSASWERRSEPHQIAGACQVYANLNNGNYPPDLGALVTATHLPAKTFILPLSFTSVPDDLQPGELSDWVVNNSPFRYAGAGLTSHSSFASIIAYEAVPHGGQVWVALRDGRTRMMTTENVSESVERDHMSDSQ